jgi:hypothetical protein
MDQSISTEAGVLTVITKIAHSQAQISGAMLVVDQLPNDLPSQPHVEHWYEVNHQEARSSPADCQNVPSVIRVFGA